MDKILKGGAAICALVGCWTLYVTIVNFGRLPYLSWNIIVLSFQCLFIGISFTPAFLLWRGRPAKRWQRAIIIVIELIVIIVGLLALAAVGASFEPSASDQV